MSLNIDKIKQKILVKQEKPIAYYYDMLGVTKTSSLTELDRNYAMLSFLRDEPTAIEAFGFIDKLYQFFYRAIQNKDSAEYTLLTKLERDKLEFNYANLQRLINSLERNKLYNRRKDFKFNVLYHPTELDKAVSVSAITEATTDSRLKRYLLKPSLTHSVIITPKGDVWTMESNVYKKRPTTYLFFTSPKDLEQLTQTLLKRADRRRANVSAEINSSSCYLSMVSEMEMSHTLYIKSSAVKTFILPNNGRLELKFTHPQTGKPVIELAPLTPFFKYEDVKVYKSREKIKTAQGTTLPILLEVFDEVQ